MNYRGPVFRQGFSLFLMAMAILTCLVPEGVRADDTRVRVGVLLHLGGDFAAWGKAYLEGIEIARDLVEQSTAYPRKLSLLVEDTRFDGKLTATAAKRFLEIEKVPVALISTFTESMIAGPLFERAAVPLLVIGDSGAEIDKLGKYVFSSGTWTQGYGLEASRYFREKLGLKEVAVLTTANPWSETTTKVFVEDFRAHGGSVIQYDELNPDQSDFRSLLSTLKRRGVPGVFAPLTAHPVDFFKQAYQLGLTMPIITAGGALDVDTIALAGIAVEGRLVTNSYLDPQRLEARSLLELYRRKYRTSPRYPSVTGRGFDGLMILAKAIQRANPLDSQSIARELQATEYRGAGTTFKMDAEGGAPLPVQVLQVKNGVLEPID